MNYNSDTNEYKLNYNFKKTMLGYDVNEVNTYINTLLKKIKKLEEERKNLSNSLTDYSKNNDYLKKILIRAEETALSLKTEAENESQLIIEDAKTKANEIIEQAKNEAKSYKDAIFKQFISYEKYLNNIINNFYDIAKKNIEILERNLSNELKSNYENINKKYLEMENQFLKNSLNNISKKEYNLIGKVLNRDIVNNNGKVIVKKNTVVTPQLIDYLISKNLYYDLITSIDF